MLWDTLREIQRILERADGHPINIDVNAERTALSWRVADMPMYEWTLSIKVVDKQEAQGR